MLSGLEFRDGNQYDLVVNNPAILTIDVGNPHPESHDLSTNEQYVTSTELDSLLQQFSTEVNKVMEQKKSLGAPMKTDTITSTNTNTNQTRT